MHPGAWASMAETGIKGILTGWGTVIRDESGLGGRVLKRGLNLAGEGQLVKGFRRRSRGI